MKRTEEQLCARTAYYCDEKRCGMEAVWEVPAEPIEHFCDRCARRFFTDVMEMDGEEPSWHFKTVKTSDWRPR